MNRTIVLLGVALLFNLMCCKGQVKGDGFLSEKVGKQDSLKQLFDRGYLKQEDMVVVSLYLSDAARYGRDIKDFTYAQLLDSIVGFKNGTMNRQAVMVAGGKDSVFIRTPQGAKIFAGMGEITMEEAVARASKDLPGKYSEADYNLLFDGSEKSANAMAAIAAANDDIAWAIGNVVMIKKEKGELLQMKLGDIVEIAKRVAECREMRPFAARLK